MSGEQDPVRARILRAILDGFTELEAAGEDRRRLAATREGVSCE